MALFHPLVMFTGESLIGIWVGRGGPRGLSKGVGPLFKLRPTLTISKRIWLVVPLLEPLILIISISAISISLLGAITSIIVICVASNISSCVIFPSFLRIGENWVCFIDFFEFVFISFGQIGMILLCHFVKLRLYFGLFGCLGQLQNFVVIFGWIGSAKPKHLFIAKNPKIHRLWDFNPEYFFYHNHVEVIR